VIKNAVGFPVILLIMFAACSHTSPVITSDEKEEYATEYTLLYYIHGDSDYLYHDPEGNPVEADQQVLNKAAEVAENASTGEVFIYHHRPQKRFLWLFPRRSSELHYYRNGNKISKIAYSHTKKDEFLQAETEIFQQYHSGKKTDGGHPKYLLFFGHEIPAVNTGNYHMTLPGVEVTEESFVSGIQGFLDGESDKFDLVVLSACSNGTPVMAKHISSVADYLLASPQNLHLSHIDSDSLLMLETDHGSSPREIAAAMADQTYNRLVESIQTTISLSVYDLNTVGNYIEELYSLTREYEIENSVNPYRENIDCSELSFYNSEAFSRGVELWYRSPRFGRQAGGGSHSGWGCKGS